MYQHYAGCVTVIKCVKRRRSRILKKQSILQIVIWIPFFSVSYVLILVADVYTADMRREF